ncbi:MAG TPA: signal peptide peptidase SppA [Caulobacteraceae bacterium]|jgi:protease-4|nr:signal peptide peptidase SppA [Caulobacteraceae bacterium]
MKQFMITVAGVFAGLALFFVGLPILLVAIFAGSAKPSGPPARTVLSLDLRRALSDQAKQNPLAAFGGSSQSVMAVVQSLHRAETDDRVKGLLIRLPEGGIAPASADELRLALKAFRKAGKPVYAHSQGIYPSGAAVSAYMLGAASDQFWMQPGASLQSMGMASDDVFLKRAFDKYGVKADYQQRYEYKNAVNPYLYDNYTPAHREATLSWMGSVYQSELAAAGADRNTRPEALKALLEAGPYIADDAKARGLIDRVGQERDAELALLNQAGEGAKLVEIGDYHPADRAKRADKAIAVVNAEGAIITGASSNSGLNQSVNVYSDDVAKAFYDAAKDKRVKAIVFRVSSPGGSDTASEQILAGVRAAKAAGKPVVVSMGTYAASGGYWIASQATEIVAQPTTLTGSIGVYGGKFALGDALARFGVDLRSLSVGGDFADAFGPAAAFTPAQKAAFSGWMDKIYEGFVERVAAGRKLPPDRVRQIAKGRVWTGDQAKALGLVDRIGGFYDALARAKQLAAIPADEEVELKSLPSPKSTLDLLQQAMGVSAEGTRTLAAAAWVLGDPRAQGLMEDLARARLGVQGSTVLAPVR